MAQASAGSSSSTSSAPSRSRWPLPTTFLLAGPRYEHVSSTLMRRRCASCVDDDAAQAQLGGLVPSGMELEDVARVRTPARPESRSRRGPGGGRVSGSPVGSGGR